MKQNLENLYQWFLSLLKSICTLCRIVLLSKKPSKLPVAKDDQIIIMGNGPSLKTTIIQHKTYLNRHPLFSVNFAMNSEYFYELKPQFHIMADPDIFIKEKHLTAFDKLSSSVTWDLILFVPCSVKRNKTWLERAKKIKENKYISLRYFNMTKSEGPIWLQSLCLKSGLAIPSPRNVLVTAIATSIRMKFKRIILIGADHSWIKNISVDTNNNVLLNDKHYYDKPNDNTVIKIVKLSQILNGLSSALKSYERLELISVRQNIEIINATPESFIDTFRKIPLPLE